MSRDGHFPSKFSIEAHPHSRYVLHARTASVLRLLTQPIRMLQLHTSDNTDLRRRQEH